MCRRIPFPHADPKGNCPTGEPEAGSLICHTKNTSNPNHKFKTTCTSPEERRSKYFGERRDKNTYLLNFKYPSSRPISGISGAPLMWISYSSSQSSSKGSNSVLMASNCLIVSTTHLRVRILSALSPNKC